MARKSFQFFLNRFFRRKAFERDLEAELRAHVAIEVRQRMERGETREAAQEAAARDFGNVGMVAEVTRDNWGFSWLENAIQDAVYAVRILRKSVLLSLVVTLTLALGIGSTTAIFTLVHGILLRPLPFPEPDRLAMIWELSPHSEKTNVVALNNFVAWQQRSHSFESMATFYGLPMNLIGVHENEQVPALKVTPEFFTTLGTPPLLGRTFRRGEYDRDEPLEVVLSYGMWQRRFGGNPDAVGQKLPVDGGSHEIIGVMPAGFGFPNVKADVYVPLGINLEEGRNYSVIARRRRGVAVSSARAEIAGIAAGTARENPELDADWSATVVPLLDQTVISIRPVLVVLSVTVGLILLLACANIANLLLMHSAGRASEISIRLALGAARSRIVRQLLVESLLLGGLGGFAGVAFAAISIHAIRAYLPESLQVPRLNEATFDWPVLVFSMGATLLSSVLFGLAPALQSVKRDLTGGLRAATRSVTSGRRLRRALVSAQVALALILVIAAGLMAQSFVRLANVDSGFHAENVLTLRMILVRAGDEASSAKSVRDMLERIQKLPGVLAAGSIGLLPMQGSNSGTWYYRTDAPEPPPNLRPVGDVSIVTPGYFKALGIPVLGGRDFDEHDRAGSPLVAILNQTASRKFFPGENPIGKYLKVWWTHTPTVKVVGVTADIHHSQLNSPPDPCLFMPDEQAPFPLSALVVRTMGDPQKLAQAIRQQVRLAEPDQGIAEIETMEQVVSDSIARPRVEALMLGAFGVMALGLAAIGVYGVIAYSVTQRAREIGIRIALGANGLSILRMVVGDGLRLTAIGLIAGLVGGLVLTRFLGSLLFEVRPDDPTTLAAAAATILGVSVLACYLPGRRAMKVDPTVMLREE